MRQALLKIMFLYYGYKHDSLGSQMGRYQSEKYHVKTYEDYVLLVRIQENFKICVQSIVIELPLDISSKIAENVFL
jgi:hypothetical protein